MLVKYSAFKNKDWMVLMYYLAEDPQSILLNPESTIQNSM